MAITAAPLRSDQFQEMTLALGNSSTFAQDAFGTIMFWPLGIFGNDDWVSPSNATGFQDFTTAEEVGWNLNSGLPAGQTRGFRAMAAKRSASASGTVWPLATVIRPNGQDYMSFEHVAIQDDRTLAINMSSSEESYLAGETIEVIIHVSNFGDSGVSDLSLRLDYPTEWLDLISAEYGAVPFERAVRWQVARGVSTTVFTARNQGTFGISRLETDFLNSSGLTGNDDFSVPSLTYGFQGFTGGERVGWRTDNVVAGSELTYEQPLPLSGAFSQARLVPQSTAVSFGNGDGYLDRAVLNVTVGSVSDITFARVDKNIPLLDSDGDGISDVAESGTGIYVSEADTGTDPLLWDSDGDGISDGEEDGEFLDPTRDDAPVLNFFAERTQTMVMNPEILQRDSNGFVNLQLKLEETDNLNDNFTKRLLQSSDVTIVDGDIRVELNPVEDTFFYRFSGSRASEN
jgi:hypothetical protein